MELKHIKELMAAMGRTGIKRIKLKKEDYELILEREDQGASRSSLELTSPYYGLEEHERYLQTPLTNRTDQALARGAEMSTGRVSPAEVPKKEDTTSTFVTSPMVGTFYSSPSPENPSFVKVGDRIEKHTVVCIIEAMKVMNEIKAGVSGTVAEILLETGQPVEFGTKLFRIVE